MTIDELRNGSIAVMCGGNSAEREISLISGKTVIDALRSRGFSVVEVDPSSANWMSVLADVDFVFIALHGLGGEDGAMQGTLQTLGLPYSGSGVLASALAMDKQRSKQVWQGIGIATPGFEELSEKTDWQDVIDRLGPVFVKPACEGSSIGMSCADTAQALQAAFEAARLHAGVVLAEKWVKGPEYTVGILGGQALPSIRLETNNTFYDYQAKYDSEETQYHCPSQLSANEETQLAQLSLRAFESLGCSVWGRVDVMRDEADDAFYVLEANTVPGMTSHSLVPMAAAAVGLDVPALVERIVNLSLAEVR